MNTILYVEVIDNHGYKKDHFWADYRMPGERKSLGDRIRSEFELGCSVHSIPVTARNVFPFVIVVGGRP